MSTRWLLGGSRGGKSTFGVTLYTSKAIPEWTILSMSRPVKFTLSDRREIELDPMDHDELMNIVLGSRPDWIGEPGAKAGEVE